MGAADVQCTAPMIVVARLRVGAQQVECGVASVEQHCVLLLVLVLG
jgi:hypothetical protein